MTDADIPDDMMKAAAECAREVVGMACRNVSNQEDWSEEVIYATRRIARAILSERGQIKTALSDPNAVHVMMLRGVIAKPSWEQIKHLYPEEIAAERERITAPPTEDEMEAAKIAFMDCPVASDSATRWSAALTAAFKIRNGE